MKNTLSELKKIKESLEDAAFLVSKGDSEREAHGKILESLVNLAQLENQINELSPNFLPSNRDSRTQEYQQDKNLPNYINEKDKEHQEVEKVTRRLPKWFRNQSQNNSKILIAFLKLSEQHEYVNIQHLKEQCSSVKDFYGNYNQMKNFGEKNHGKVFEEKDGVITLWEPVQNLIYRLYDENCKQ